MSRPASETYSFWAFAALAGLLLLQLLPYPGVVLMLLGAPLLAGVLVQLLLATLFVEAVTRRLPRIFACIPFLFYGAYYAMFVMEGREVAEDAAKLRSQNEGVAFRFDPATQALVVEDASTFASEHDLPVVYEKSPFKDAPDAYVAHRRLPRHQCEQAHAALSALPTAIERSRIEIYYPRKGGKLDGEPSKTMCVLSLPETPTKAIVSASKSDPPTRPEGAAISEGTVDFAYLGRTVASYSIASIDRLPAFPSLVIGCVLVPGTPPWPCTAKFLRRRTEIVTDPNAGAEEDPVGAVLGIPMLSEPDRETASPASNLPEILDRIRSYARRVNIAQADRNDHLFSAFTEFLDDKTYEIVRIGAFNMLSLNGTEKVSDGLREAVTRDPARLSALRDKMIEKLVDLDRHGVSKVSPWVDLVETALLTMPKDQFTAVPDASLRALLAYLAKTERWRDGGLYIRAADAGPRTLDFYAADLKRLGVAEAALAICRLGHADEATRKRLEDLYLKTRPVPKMAIRETVRDNSAFLVALLALADRQFLLDNPIVTQDRFVRHWYDRVLDGKGRTEVGPNNCRELTQTAAGSPPFLAPALVWRDGDFAERDAQ